MFAIIIEKQPDREANMTAWPLDPHNQIECIEQLFLQENSCVKSGRLESFTIFLDEETRMP